MLLCGAGQAARGACWSTQRASTTSRTARGTRVPVTAHAAAGGSGGNGSGPAAAPMAAAPSIVTDAAVPEGHVGLHGFLYGEGGSEEAHGTGRGYTVREGEDDGSALLPVASYLSVREGEKPVGVYALYDSRRNLQYVGYARNMVLAVRGHLARVGEERCAWVRAMVFANRAMQSRAALQREADNWMEEAGTLPPGNGAEAELWEGPASGSTASSSVDVSLMSADELAEYEERKLKMRKAMGENLHDDVAGEAEDSKLRRLRLIAAVEGDDWSAVINEQTAEATEAAAGRGAAGAGEEEGQAAAGQAATGQVVTPFARASVHRAVGNAGPEGGEAPLQMTVETVDRALDDVRPYLIADGGNVDVVAVESGRVMLQLQGACGTCPSSSATMKMGIERSLKAAFGDQLVEVLQVGAVEEPGATVESVDMHLNMLRGAVAAYGGTVEVASIEQGVCTLRYQGPKPIAYGLRAAVRDKFPEIIEVLMIDPDTEEPIKF